jgi:hypothetical protein
VPDAFLTVIGAAVVMTLAVVTIFEADKVILSLLAKEGVLSPAAVKGNPISLASAGVSAAELVTL